MSNDKFLILEDSDDESFDINSLINESMEENNDIVYSDDEDVEEIYEDIEDGFYDIIAEGSIIPDIKIEVKSDENDEKVVQFKLDIVVNESLNEKITIDLNITKKTYLMIAEELFK